MGSWSSSHSQLKTATNLHSGRRSSSCSRDPLYSWTALAPVCISERTRHSEVREAQSRWGRRRGIHARASTSQIQPCAFPPENLISRGAAREREPPRDQWTTTLDQSKVTRGIFLSETWAERERILFCSFFWGKAHSCILILNNGDNFSFFFVNLHFSWCFF